MASDVALRRLVREELERVLRPALDVLTHQVAGQFKDGATLMTTAEVAELLRVDARTLRRMVHAGEVPPPIRIGNRTDRWRRTTIESFLRKKEKQALTAGRR